MHCIKRCIRLLSMFLALVSGAYAGVQRVDITSRTDVLGGKEFGERGAYERIAGRVYFSIAVANPRNRAIVDLGNAVNLNHGEVEFSSDFVVLRPKDASKANGTMILENPNRGRAHIIALVDGGDWDAGHSAGDAWLLRNGYSIAMLGWQWDAVGDGALRLYAPIVKENGKTITGLVRGDLMPSKATTEIPLGHLINGSIGGSEYPVAAPADSRNSLTVRDSREAKRQLIPRSQWRFAHAMDGKLVASDRYLHLDVGFQPGKLYEYVYVAADPVVGSSRVDLQACKLEYSIVSPK